MNGVYFHEWAILLPVSSWWYYYQSILVKLWDIYLIDLYSSSHMTSHFWHWWTLGGASWHFPNEETKAEKTWLLSHRPAPETSSNVWSPVHKETPAYLGRDIEEQHDTRRLIISTYFPGIKNISQAAELVQRLSSWVAFSDGCHTSSSPNISYNFPRTGR